MVKTWFAFSEYLKIKQWATVTNIIKDRIDEKKNYESLAVMHYKPLYNINRSEKWSKKYTNLRL